MVVALVFLLFVSSASAQPLEEINWDKATRLTLAQGLVAEAGWEGSTAERAAISYVLAKRWAAMRQRPKYRGITFRAVVRSYCSIFKIKTKRSWILGLPWAPLEPKNRNRGPWEDLRAFVTRFSRGEVLDPIPEAIHFGSPQDHTKRVLRGLVPGVRRIVRRVEDPDTGLPAVLRNYYYRWS